MFKLTSRRSRYFISFGFYFVYPFIILGIAGQPPQTFWDYFMYYLVSCALMYPLVQIPSFLIALVFAFFGKEKIADFLSWMPFFFIVPISCMFVLFICIASLSAH